MDPSVDLDLPDTEFSVDFTWNQDIENADFNLWDIGVIGYPGTVYNTLALRLTMVDALQGIDASRYTNVAHTIDSVRIVVQTPGIDSFALIGGPFYKSQYLLGANMNTTIYPNVMTGRYGNLNTTGISPRAYQDGAVFRPYDNYYYADFLTRLHRDDPQDASSVTTYPSD